MQTYKTTPCSKEKNITEITRLEETFKIIEFNPRYIYTKIEVMKFNHANIKNLRKCGEALILNK